MAVVPMKKARLLVHRESAEAALRIVQAAGAVEFEPVAVAERDNEETAAAQEVFPHETLLPRVQQLVQFLEAYQPQPGIIQQLLKGVQIPLSETAAGAYLTRTEDIAAAVSHGEELHARVSDVREALRHHREQLEWLDAWQDLPCSFGDLTTHTTVTLLVERAALTSARASGEQTLAELLTTACAEVELVAAVHAVRDDACAVTLSNDASHRVSLDAIVKECQAEYVTPPPVVGTVAEAQRQITSELDTLVSDQANLEQEITAFAAEHLTELQVTSDVLTWQRERYTVLETAQYTSATVLMEGWIDARRVDEVTSALDRQRVLAALTTTDPGPDEVPPVEIANHPLLRPFEVVTRLYGLPGHRDLDPTAFLAGFFFLFFGLSLTDVGYGIFLMTAALLILFVLHVSKTVRLFGSLLFLMGASSTLVGLLFGGYLGIDPTTLPAVLQSIQQFDPIADPLPVFYMALGLGVVQIMFGMVLKIVSDAKNGQLLDGVLDQGPWLALFVALILYGAAETGYAFTSYGQELLLLSYAAGIAIVVASGRRGDTILQKARSSLLSVYQSVGYFSDILSYSRLLALGLATTALAFAVNLIADIVRDAVPYLGVVLAAVVLVIGHAFTLAVNTLGAFIHSARLQFVEFFGKFITGTGRTFKPLARRESYVTVVHEDT